MRAFVIAALLSLAGCRGCSQSFAHGQASFHLATEREATEAVLREKQSQRALSALLAP